ACGKAPAATPPMEAGTDGGPDAPPAVACTRTSGTTVSLRNIGTVNGSAVLATAAPNDPRLFVVEQVGLIRIFDHEHLLPDAFLDISDNSNGPVRAGGEEGLLGLAFHPDYATNHQFYVYYTADNPNGGDPLID